jgi:hypothetical protein
LLNHHREPSRSPRAAHTRALLLLTPSIFRPSIHPQNVAWDMAKEKQRPLRQRDDTRSTQDNIRNARTGNAPCPRPFATTSGPGRHGDTGAPGAMILPVLFAQTPPPRDRPPSPRNHLVRPPTPRRARAYARRTQRAARVVRCGGFRPAGAPRAGKPGSGESAGSTLPARVPGPAAQEDRKEGSRIQRPRWTRSFEAKHPCTRQARDRGLC